jgi:hypothetical protein
MTAKHMVLNLDGLKFIKSEIVAISMSRSDNGFLLNTAAGHVRLKSTMVTVTKNWAPFEFVPEFAMDSVPAWACFNSGFREVADPKGGRNPGVVRCDRCSYWEFRRAA